MRSDFRFLTTPTADTPSTSILLQYGSKRYLFGGVAEGTQRAFIEEPGKATNTNAVFITGRMEWSNTGGLFGLILSLADINNAKLLGDGSEAHKKKVATVPETRLSLFGARNLTRTLATARTFILRKKMPVDVQDIDQCTCAIKTSSVIPDPVFQDSNIRVWPIVTSPRPQVGSKSPGKRTFDDLNQDAQQTSTEFDAVDDTIVRSVVSEMFGSSWTLDKLVETRLADVNANTPIFVRGQNKLEPYTGPRAGGSEPVPDIFVYTREPWPATRVRTLPAVSPNLDSLSYIVKSYVKRGKFDPVRAQELGLHDRKEYNRLVAGESLINDKGESISPEQVLGPDRPGQCIAIFDLPTSDYVEPLLASLESQHASLLADVGGVFWILGAGVAGHPRLCAYIENAKNIRHVVTSSDLSANRLAFDTAAMSTVRLQTIDPKRYTSLVYADTPPITSSSNPLPEHVMLADRGTKITLDPDIGIVERVRQQESFDLVTDRVIKDMPRAVLDRAAEAQAAVRQDSAALEKWASKIERGDTEIIALGTGSASPSKYRNVSATLIRVPGWGSMLLDCGENTLGQLKRLYPPTELLQLLTELKIIWISHIHADHHLGTVSLLKAHYQAVHGGRPSSAAGTLSDAAARMAKQPNTLSVIADSPMLHMLWEYNEIEDIGFSRIAPLQISAADVATSRPSKLWWFQPQGTSPSMVHSRSVIEPSTLGLADVQAVLVRHCRGARAVAFTWPSLDAQKKPLKISYSGDCRPSRDFAEIGRDSTVCIHEATFDDELGGDAQAKLHSTTSEALEVATLMNARAVVLTHFSQRYQKIPVLEFAADDRGNGAQSSSVWESEPNVRDDGDRDVPVDEPGMMDLGSKSVVSAAEVVPAVDVAKVRVRVKANQDMKVCVAFDYMRVKVNEIAQLEKFMPALIELFQKDEALSKTEVEQKAVPDSVTRSAKSEAKRLKRKASKENHLAAKHADAYIAPEQRMSQ